MDEKSLIFGVSYAVDGLIMALLKQNIDLNIEEDYYVNISTPPIPDSTDFGVSVISGVFVDVTEELVKATIGWLREREKEHVENPKLKICINGNLLNIDVQDMEIMMNVLKECSKKKREQHSNKDS
ncbi:hypothetical protein KAS24_01365 [Candidatus Bathyarchaeota archaeon]|nr:hypothetical protein [Candidatus Bathyarchaeota archaeon]